MGESSFDRAKRLVRKVISEYYNGDTNYFESTHSSVESAEEEIFLMLKNKRNRHQDDYALIDEWMGT